MKLPHLGQVLAAGAAALSMTATALVPAPAYAQFGGIVYDPTNYSQNILTAARTLEQINNQIRQLQNQAASLINEARNLQSLPLSVLEPLQTQIRQTQALIGQAQRMAYNVQAIETQFAAQYKSVDLTQPQRVVVHRFHHVAALERRQRPLAPARLGDVLEDPHRFVPGVRPVRPKVQIDEQVTIGREVQRLLAAVLLALLFDRIDALPNQHEQALGFAPRRLRRPWATMHTDGLAPRRAALNAILNHIALDAARCDPQSKPSEAGIPGVNIARCTGPGSLDCAQCYRLIGHDSHAPT